MKEAAPLKWAKIERLLDGIVAPFGYDNGISELKRSLFKIGISWKGGIITLIVGIMLHLSANVIFKTIGDISGVGIMALAGIGILLALEWFSGVVVSMHVRKEKFSSLKMGRIIIKTIIYMSLLAGLWMVTQFEIKGASESKFISMAVDGARNTLGVIHIVVFLYFCANLVISVLENVASLGWLDSAPLLRWIKKFLAKYLAINPGVEPVKKNGD